MSNAETKDARTYGQWCPIAVGLDIVGDRWTLLICRELMFGDARFTDLKSRLPGIAPNLLSERLRALQMHGLVETAELPPPAARSVYRLTPSGSAAVLPVLRAVARLGAPHLGDDAPETFDALRAVNALLAPWYRGSGDELRVRVVLPSSAADVAMAPGRFEVTLPSGTPEVTIETTASALAAVRRGEPFAARVSGSAANRKLALRLFQLGTPVKFSEP